MKQIFPKKHTEIELIMQKALTDAGYKFETNKAVLGICQPDIVFPESRIAIFCDGDYWHNLPSYIERDKRITATLKSNGWEVFRFWEHRIKDDVQECLAQVPLEGVKLSEYC
jgi:G:T-mismatch repair DNA endonuclease (very short patch repair protein)